MMRGLKHMGFILIFILFTVFLMFFSSAEGKTIVVDKNGDGDYTSIQPAIDVAVNGDTISVKSGTYYENPEIINKTISLIGENKDNTIIDGSQNGHVVTLSNANSTMITGFTIRNAGGTGNDCIIVSDSYNVSINNNVVKNSADSDGISMIRCHYVYISGNTVESNINGNGLLVAYSTNNIIQGNTFQGNQKGVFLQYYSSDNLVSDNTFEGNSLYGVQIWAASNNNLLFRNQFLNNGENAKDSCTNKWYNQETHEGNYWDDYDGEDNNNDGIGDTPYTIPGGSNQDIYVLGFFEETNQPPMQNQPPTADAGGPYTGYVNEYVYFDGSGSHDSDGVIVSYHWSFGDGDTSDSSQIPHKYSEPGTYTVVLTVVDNNGAQDVDTSTVTVLAVSHNQPPVADAGGPYYGKERDALFFTASLSYDPDGHIVSYLWDFGDGEKAFGENVTHVYSGTGSYRVTLTVADSNGSIDVSNTTAFVLPANAADELVADAGVSYTGFVGEKIVFKASANEGNISVYKWDFGDGTVVTTTEETVNHSYENAGVYNVKLTLTDVFGRTAYDNATAVISDPWKKSDTPGFEVYLLFTAFTIGLLVLKRNSYGGMR